MGRGRRGRGGGAQRDGEATTPRRDGGMKAGLNTDLEMKEAQDGWRRS